MGRATPLHADVTEIVPLRRNRDFLLLWSGQVVSTVGTRVTFVAFPLLVLALTGSPGKAGLVGFAQTLPYALVYLPAGAVVDRSDYRRVMLFADGGRAVALASIAVALLVGKLTFPQVVVVALLEGTLYVFFQVAESAALPHVVRRQQLATALAQNQARDQGAGLVGAPLGGALFALSRAAPFVADAVSYTVSFLSLLLIRAPLRSERERSDAGLVADVREGIAWYRRQPFLTAIIVIVGATNILYTALFLVLIVRAREGGSSPALIGAMFSCAGAGAIAGALIAPYVQRNVAAKLVLVGVLWFDAVGFAVFVVLPNAIAFGVDLGLLALLSSPFNVVLTSYRYALVPDRLLGRTASVARLVTWGSIPLGPLLGGFLVDVVETGWTLAILAGGMLLAAATATVIPTIRNAPDLRRLLARAEEQASLS